MNAEFDLSQWDGKFGNKRSLPDTIIGSSEHVPHIIDSALRRYDELNPVDRPDETALIQRLLDAVYIQRERVGLLEIQHGDSIKSKLTGLNDPIQRVQAFNGRIKIGSDVDKTLTETDSYLNHIPGSVLAENYMDHPDHGRAVRPLVHARYWKIGMDHPWAREYSKQVGKNAPLRPGVISFF